MYKFASDSIVEESSAAGNNAAIIKPVIRPVVKFLVFHTGSSFNLSCDIDVGWNITWRVPFSVEKRNSRTFTTWASLITDGHIRIRATLTVENATYLDMGHYTCQRSDNSSIAVNQFVFVQGSSSSSDQKYQCMLYLAVIYDNYSLNNRLGSVVASTIQSLSRTEFNFK